MDCYSNCSTLHLKKILETASDSEGSELSDDNKDTQISSNSHAPSIHGEIDPFSKMRAIL